MVFQKGMAASIGQYAPVFLPGEPRSLTEEPGTLQSTGSQRVGYHQSDPASVDARLFACGSSAPVRVEREGGAAAWLAGRLDCLHRRSYGPIGVLFQASGSWRSEGVFGQCFSLALPVQALRGLPCLRSSEDWNVRHLKGAPSWGPLCRSVLRHLKGHLVGVLSVDQCVRHLKGHLAGVLSVDQCSGT